MNCLISFIESDYSISSITGTITKQLQLDKNQESLRDKILR